MANPLTFVMPLAAGTDLTTVLEALAGQQQKIDEALTSIGTVHYARFVLFDASSPTLQPTPAGSGPYSVAVITEYDGDFNAYIQAFANQIGDVFDMLLTYAADDGKDCVPVAANAAKFQAYVRSHDASQQPPNSGLGLYSAYPYTVQEVLAGS